MNKVEREVVEFYNNRQDEWSVWKIFVNSKDEKIDLKGFINEDIGNIYIRKKENKESGECIGFYEWLFNPKYKVFEVFNLGGPDVEYFFGISDGLAYTKNYRGLKPIDEILTYLSKQTGGDNE
jgi:hypothetical protein